MCLLLGSRVEVLLVAVSCCCLVVKEGANLLNLGSSTGREEPEPERGV